MVENLSYRAYYHKDAHLKRPNVGELRKSFASIEELKEEFKVKLRRHKNFKPGQIVIIQFSSEYKNTIVEIVEGEALKLLVDSEDYPNAIERLKVLRAEENDIGCGYCKLEVGCIMKVRGKNMAREGCLHFDKVEFKINKNGSK